MRVKNNPNKPIRSAETLAALRAAVNSETRLEVLCQDDLAKHFLGVGLKIFVNATPQYLLRKLIEIKAPGSYCFAITRTKHFDKILLDEISRGMEQVVLLGAGYDTRPYRFQKQLGTVDIYEIDFPGTQKRKRRVIARVFDKGLPSNIRYLSFDFNRTDLAETLINSGFSTDRKTVFLWEGVSYYIPIDAVCRVLSFVRSCAKGSSIVFDYATRDFVNGDRRTYGAKQIAKWLKKIDEPFLFGINGSEIYGFLADSGLEVITEFGPEELKGAYLKTRNGKLLGETLGHVRMVHARALRTDSR